ncbi:MAG TPA: YbjQ family protein [Candidatus Nanoarchaeia archaeon]|nr:YbjQ family protein [Candidatus Nanoarchaeia archaeon]
MIVVTTEAVEGKIIKQCLGMVRGSTIRSRWLGRDIMAGLKTLVGGEIKSYTDMMNKARDEAQARMEEEAKKLGADAIVAVRFSTANVMQGAAEILAYGTAVKLR